MSHPMSTPTGQPFRLAMPNPDEVNEFAQQYKAQFSVELSPQDALLLATHYLHMFQILNHEPDKDHVEEKVDEIQHDELSGG